MLRSFFVGTDVKTCTTINIFQETKVVLLTSNSDIVDRSRVRRTETQRFSVCAQSFLWLTAIGQR